MANPSYRRKSILKHDQFFSAVEKLFVCFVVNEAGGGVIVEKFAYREHNASEQRCLLVP